MSAKARILHGRHTGGMWRSGRHTARVHAARILNSYCGGRRDRERKEIGELKGSYVMPRKTKSGCRLLEWDQLIRARGFGATWEEAHQFHEIASSERRSLERRGSQGDFSEDLHFQRASCGGEARNRPLRVFSARRQNERSLENKEDRRSKTQSDRVGKTKREEEAAN